MTVATSLGSKIQVLHSSNSTICDASILVCRLNIRLHQRHAGNMLCVKLISPEDLMEEHGDPHSRPNIDINFVAPHGRLVCLPEGAQLQY